MTTLLVVSAQDEAALELSSFNRDYFMATLRSRRASGTARVGTYMSHGIEELFRHFDENWRGWTGVREWTSLEGELSLSAKADKVGHVFLEVALLEGFPARWRLEAQLVLEAGMLSGLARQAQEFEKVFFRDP